MSIHPYRDARPVIGQRVWVDPAAVVIGRVTIGDNASTWPGAVLRGDVNCNEIGGRALDAKEIAMLAESAEHYVALKDDYLETS